MLLLRVVETKKETLPCPSVTSLPFFKRTHYGHGTFPKMPFKSDIKQFTFIVCFLRTGLQWTFAGQSSWIACQPQPGHCGSVLAWKRTMNNDTLAKVSFQSDIKQITFIVCFSVFWIFLDFPGHLNHFLSF